MKTTEEITEILENLNEGELFDLWNDYTEETRQDDSRIHYFDDEFFGVYFTDPQEAARATYFGKINSWNDKYIMFNGYGNLVSSYNITDMISIGDLANHIFDNQDNFKELLAD